MKIRKAFQGTIPDNKILDTYSTSQTDTYSCNYVNGIVETGNNNNGNYIKFIDGTMICYKSVSNSCAMTSGWGSLYEGSMSLGSWPVSFISTPQVQVTNNSTIGAMIEGFGSTPTTTSAGSIYLVRPTSATYTVTINIFGIGKWK